MSGPFKRRSSLKTLPTIGTTLELARRRSSAISISSGKPTTAAPQLTVPSAQELPWDVVDRFLLPILFCHAASVILSTILNICHIAVVSTVTLFILFTIVTVSALLFYHNLKVMAGGKAVLVTGCDTRIGSALVRHLDEQGFTVFAGFQDSLQSTNAEQLREECSARVHVLQLDVTSETQILAASLYAVEHLPDGASGLWAVVHASSWMTFGEVEWIPPQVMRKAVDINVLGPTRLTQVMLPLVRRATGRIIFVTSGLCKVPAIGRGLHCSLLAAIEAQADCLRKELKKRRVDVVIVAPGEFSSGSSWWSDEPVLKQAREMWAQLDGVQRSDFGQEHFEAIIRNLENRYLQSQDADIGPVLRALTNAIVRTFPMARYTPVSRTEKMQSFIADHLPSSFYDAIYA